MQISAFELVVANLALRTTERVGSDGLPLARLLDIGQIEDGVAINKKLKASVVGDKFVDSDIELSTTEKALLLSFLERPWDVEYAEFVLSLKEKLK
jgi:hypothetical protein